MILGLKLSYSSLVTLMVSLKLSKLFEDDSFSCLDTDCEGYFSFSRHLSPVLYVMTAVSWTLKTPKLARVAKARILVKVLKVEAAASPHIPLLVEVLSLVVAAPRSLPVTGL